MNIETLPNGLRILFRPTTGETGHFAVFIHAGTRDEPLGLEGLAHFIEHTLFKGTQNRSLFQILSRLDAVGGELNAYTTKEETCIYGTFHRRYLGRAAELISDIVQNATFPPSELIKEKEVVAEEIRSYLDSPSEQIFDDFEQQLFGQHALAHPILGTEKSLQKIRRHDILAFLKQHYHAQNMVCCITGPYTKDEVVQIVSSHFSRLSNKGNLPVRKKFSGYRPKRVEIERGLHQAHCIIGAPAYPTHHPKRMALALLMNILGGPAMNAKLHLIIREKHGLAYTVDAGYSTFTDTGLVYIYLGTDTANLERCMDLVNREVQRFRDKKISPAALRAAQLQYEGQQTIAEDNKLNVMLSLGRQLLQYNKISSLEEICKSIRAIQAEQILEVANEILAPERLSHLIYKGK